MTRNSKSSDSSMWSKLRGQGFRDLLPSSGKWTKRRLAGLTVLILASLAGVLVVTSTAAAHHPEITVNLNCAGTVSYTVSADVDDASRNNADVRVYDDAALTHQVGSGSFSSSNSWSFSGSYTVAASVTSVTLTPVAVGQWGNAQASYPTTGPSATATKPANCPPSALVTTPTVMPNDSGTVTGSNPTGTLKFELFPPSDATCSGTPSYSQTVALSNGTASTSNTSFLASTIGTWRWRLTYSGDSVNPAKTTACGIESFELDGDFPPSVRTDIHDPSHAVVTSVNAGVQVHDKVFVTKRAGTPSSLAAPTGQVIFHRYTTIDCSGTSVDQTVTLAADGTAESAAFSATGSKMSYKADYQGDALYPARAGACEPLTVTPVCTAGTFTLTGNSASTGTRGNIRQFTATNNAQVRASGFNRTTQRHMVDGVARVVFAGPGGHECERGRFRPVSQGR